MLQFSVSRSERCHRRRHDIIMGRPRTSPLTSVTADLRLIGCEVRYLAEVIAPCALDRGHGESWGRELETVT